MTRTEIAVLLAIVAVGLLLRLTPWLRDPAIALRDDAAYHERLVLATVAAGHVPAVDALSEPPQGRRLAEHLPLGLYSAAATFHRVLAPIDRLPVHTHLILFIALAGALIAIPVHLATRALGAAAGPALLAAAIAVCMPAHLHRTFGHWVRYDAPGTLLIAMHVAFALRALRWDGRAEASSRVAGIVKAPRASEMRGLMIDAALSAAFLITAASVWRVTLLFPLLEAVFVLLAVCVSGAGRGLAVWFATVALTGTAAFAVMDPMRAQHFVISVAWVLVVGAASVAAISAAKPHAPAWMRLAWVGAAFAIALIVMTVLPAGPYDATAQVLRLKLARLLHLADAGSPLSHLMLDVIELYSLSPAALVIGPQQFFALGPWLVAAPFVLRGVGGRRGVAATLASAPGLLAFLCVVLAVLTMLFSRNKVLLAPWVAVVCGMIAARLFVAPPTPATPLATAVARRGKGKTRTREAQPTQPGNARFALSTAFAISIIATMGTGAYLAWSRSSHADPALEATGAFLNEHAPANAIVGAPWWYGYDLQSHAARATLADGLLENRENQRRIIEFYTALLAPDPDTLTAFCRAHQVTHLLIPPADEFTNFAWIADPAMAERIVAGHEASAEELDRTLVRMMRREPVQGFEVAFENERFRVLAVAAADSGVAGGAPGAIDRPTPVSIP